MKRLILLPTIIIASEISVLNPTWEIVDFVNNFENFLKNKEYNKMINELETIKKSVKLKNSYIDEKVYNPLFKDKIWDKMIAKIYSIYKKEKKEKLKTIIKLMIEIKKLAKKREVAIA